MSSAAATVDAPVPERAVEQSDALARIRDRLNRKLPTDRLRGWLLPLAVTLFAGLARFWHITQPGGHTLVGVPSKTAADNLVFDETYYIHDSWSLVHHGVELNGQDNGPGFVVHPPLGKWFMGWGEELFDHGKTVALHATAKDPGTIYPASPLSWRVASAVFGTLAVLLVCRIGRRMFASTALGCIAGLLVALDGLEFVQSRTAMLDIFLMFWVVAAFGCLVVDRDDGRRRLANRLDAPLHRDAFGPFLGIRPWRWAAGVCLGAACATKWSGAFFIPAFIVLALAWDSGARRTAGAKLSLVAAGVQDGLFSLLPFLILPALVYTASWTGWFLSDGAHAYDHDHFVHAGQSWFGHDWAVFHGWLQYHREIYGYAKHLSWDKNPHPYLSRPWGWLLLDRPVAYYYQTPNTCGAASCSKEVLGIGNPALWWAAGPALLAIAWSWFARRDWRAGAILVMFGAAYLPWIHEDGKHRVMFLFYLLPGVPFMALAVTMVIGAAVGSAVTSDVRRVVGISVAAAYLAIVVALFGFFYPVLAGRTMTYDAWYHRIWFRHCAAGDAQNQHHENAPCWI